MGAARGCSQCGRETIREGSSQWVPALGAADGLWEPLVYQKSKFRSDPFYCCAHAPEASGGELNDTQPHSLPGLCVVTAGLSEYAVPIVGLCHHCGGGDTTYVGLRPSYCGLQAALLNLSLLATVQTVRIGCEQGVHESWCIRVGVAVVVQKW